MPYNEITELPPSVKNNLNEKQQRIFKEVFNSVLEKTGSEERAFKAAWSVAKRDEG